MNSMVAIIITINVIVIVNFSSIFNIIKNKLVNISLSMACLETWKALC